MSTGTIPAGVFRPDLGLVQGTEVFADPGLRGDGLAVALEWLRAEQWPALGHAIVGPADVARWVDSAAEALAPTIRGRRARAGLAALQDRLGDELLGETVVVGDVHGEILPGRWWFAEGGDEIVAVDGWLPMGRNLPEVDEVLLVLAARNVAQGLDPAMVTAAAVDVLELGWTDAERDALGSATSSNPTLSPGSIVLLAWLTAAAAGEGPSALVHGRSHERREIRSFLESLAPEAGAPLVVRDDLLVVQAPAEAVAAADRTAAAVAAASDRAEERARVRRGSLRTVVGLAIGSVLWLVGTWHLDPGAMTDLGLLSILRPEAYLGLAVLIATFAVEVVSPRPTTWRLAAPLATVVLVLHGTPAWLYGTLRYSWAWKHLGILDYIHRHGSVDTHAASLDVYHNWPGFFAVNSALTDLFGLRDAVQYARWWPVLANLAVVPALLFVFRGLKGGEDRRTAWTAVAVFLVSNWIGQDYFSPQSMGFLLYLVILGLVLRHLRTGAATEGAAARRWGLGVALLATAAMVTSHQVSPVVLVASLVALVVLRQARAKWFLAAVLAMVALWSATGARVYMTGNVSSLFEGLGEPVANADGNLVDQGHLSADQVLVSTMGRLALVAVVLLAGFGLVRAYRRRAVDLAAIALTAAPGALLFANRFGGEIGFRSYLFALPFLSWFVALGFRSGAGSGPATRRPALRGVAVFVVTSLLLSGFLFGYFGKDQWYRFTGGEVAASDYVLTDAVPGSLLVTVTANYPGQWKEYEKLTYVPIATEPVDSRARVLADPVDVLAGWLSESSYTKGYILITRSQEREVEALGALPTGSVARLRRALEASPRFRLAFASADAQVFELVPDAGAG